MDRREHGVGADGALEQLVDAAIGGGLGPGPGGCGGGGGQRDAVEVHGRPLARLLRQ